MHDFFATCPKGLEQLLLAEIQAADIAQARQTVAGVSFSAELTVAVELCFKTRFASRVLLILKSFECHTTDTLYHGIRQMPWEQYFAVGRSIAVDYSGGGHELHSAQYCALLIKDGICERFMEVCRRRPSVDRQSPEVRIVVNLVRSQAIVCLEFSGRTPLPSAPPAGRSQMLIRDNLANAILERSGIEGYRLICNPLCGGGTLLLQAADRLCDRLPGLSRAAFGFTHLLLYDQGLSEYFAHLRNAAELQARAGLAKAEAAGIRLVGYEQDAALARQAEEQAAAAGYGSLIAIRNAPLENLTNPFGEPCLVVCTLPSAAGAENFYELIGLYALLGEQFKTHFAGSRVAVISSALDLLSCLKLKATRNYALNNGQTACRLRIFEISATAHPTCHAIDEFKNRLRKNLRHVTRYARSVHTDAYRIYDAELPQYQIALDFYAGAYVLYEYAAPRHVDRNKARNHLYDVISAVLEVTGCRGEDLVVKQRSAQSREQQYQPAGERSGRVRLVTENGLFFAVNVHDYLDTGLFLDARLLRALIMRRADGYAFLNLFCYTASASVAAARGGARCTVNVDMSRTYLDWAVDNFKLNGLGLENHQFIQQDCLYFLSHMASARFELVLLDPPTFSNSKRMSATLDVVRDHVQLLANLTQHLCDEAWVLFCTNKRQFHINAASLTEYGYELRDLTAGSIPEDFRHSRSIHTLYELHFVRERCTGAIKPLTAAYPPGRWSGAITPRALGAPAASMSDCTDRLQVGKPGHAMGGADSAASQAFAKRSAHHERRDPIGAWRHAK